MLHQIPFLCQRVSERDRASFHVYKDSQLLISLLILSNQVRLEFIQQLFCASLVKQVPAHWGAQTIFLQHLNEKDFEIYHWENLLKFTYSPYQAITPCLMSVFRLHLRSVSLWWISVISISFQT